MSNLIPFNELQQMASAVADSKLFGFTSPMQAAAMMLVAQAEGLHPATIVQDYDIIQGRPARKTHSVLARFQAAGGTVQWHDFTETKVSGTFTHPRGGSLKVDWTIDMAQRAGLAGKDNWKKTPRAMLRARCIAEGVRATYPAALGGHLIVEEAADIALETMAAKQMGMVEEVTQPAQPTWPADAFATQMERWGKAVAAGLKSVDDILAMARSKGVLSAEQEAAIRAIKPAQARAAESNGEPQQ